MQSWDAGFRVVGIIWSDFQVKCVKVIIDNKYLFKEILIAEAVFPLLMRAI